jgi:predicted AAA+ superfamily ATPase
LSYLPRILDRELSERMTAMGAVLIEGPKACGKTATASQVAKTIIRLDENESARDAIALAPDQLFDQPTPILFDEWQAEPAIWNQVRRQVDDRRDRGLYILTGSATPNDDTNRHSGAGRFGVIQMRPMSLFESGHSNGYVSLEALLNGESKTAVGMHLSFDQLLERIVIGGWPSLVTAKEAQTREWLRE